MPRVYKRTSKSLASKADNRLFFIRLDDSEILGLYSFDGYLDAHQFSEAEIVSAILERIEVTAQPTTSRTDTLVRNLRAQTQLGIQNRCGTTRSLVDR